jgi:hypothetical protein
MANPKKSKKKKVSGKILIGDKPKLVVTKKIRKPKDPKDPKAPKKTSAVSRAPKKTVISSKFNFKVANQKCEEFITTSKHSEIGENGEVKFKSTTYLVCEEDRDHDF